MSRKTEETRSDSRYDTAGSLSGAAWTMTGKPSIVGIVMREAIFRSTLVSVSPYVEEDLEDALLVYRESEDFLALGPVPKASLAMVLEDIRHSREDEGVYCMIRDGGGEAAGVLDFIPRYGGKGTAFLSLLMIRAAFRGRGIGSETVALLEDHLRAVHAVRTVESGVQTNNEGGIRFWTGRGYRIVSGPERQPDTTVAFRLRKELQAGRRAGGPAGGRR